MLLHSQGLLASRNVRSKFQFWMGGGDGGRGNSENAKNLKIKQFLGRRSENISVVDSTGKTSVLIAYRARKDEKCRKVSDDLGEMQQNFRSVTGEHRYDAI